MAISLLPTMSFAVIVFAVVGVMGKASGNPILEFSIPEVDMIPILETGDLDAEQNHLPYLTEEDFENARNLPVNLNETDILDEMTDPELFQGDILGIDMDILRSEGRLVREEHVRTKRGALISNTRDYHWPKGVVPYIIDTSYTTAERAKIAQGILDLQASTCVRFVPKTSQPEHNIHVKFLRDTVRRCASYVGRIGAALPQQTIYLHQDCLAGRAVVHEMIHALGFFHEQSRPDRDSYVTINFGNIDSSKTNNFVKTPATEADTFGHPYDYLSIMHYTAYSFSNNGQPTIVRKDGSTTMGGLQMSQWDIKDINAYYQEECATRVQTTPLHRLHNPTTEDNMLTQSESEKNTILGNPIKYGYNYEKSLGNIASAPQTVCPGLVPLYRLYSRPGNNHFYTTSGTEAVRSGFKREGSSGYCVNTPSCEATRPLYRLYNMAKSNHLYTTDEGEKNLLTSHPDWRFEEVACYIWN